MIDVMCTCKKYVSKNGQYEKVVIDGHDFATVIYYDTINNTFLDHYYNRIRPIKSKSSNYSSVRYKVFGLNSIKPHTLTITRFDTGQFTASYH